MKFHRREFFDDIRVSLFEGDLFQKQVEGIENILNYWETYPINNDLRHLAYMLATVYWETGQTMQPIKEGGGLKYLKAKKYWPFYGRGLVQLTWEDNYKLMTKIIRAATGDDVDFVRNPDLVMEWKYALPIMFEGMFRGTSSRGDFTGKALEDYFNRTTDDPKGARRIINGTDRDDEIAGFHRHFLSALRRSVIMETPVVPVNADAQFTEIVGLIGEALSKLQKLYEAKQ